MQRQHMAITVFTLLFVLFFSGCELSQLIGPTITPVPSDTRIPTMTFTYTPAPTSTSTPLPTLSPTPIIAKFTTTIPANEPWFNTGIMLKEGQSLTISASGRVNTIQGLARGDTPSPDGQANNPPCSPYNSSECLMSDVYWGTLIGKVGNGEPFIVGSQLQILVSGNGVLYLSVNDNKDYFFDNSGEFEATIVVIG